MEIRAPRLFFTAGGPWEPVPPHPVPGSGRVALAAGLPSVLRAEAAGCSEGPSACHPSCPEVLVGVVPVSDAIRRAQGGGVVGPPLLPGSLFVPVLPLIAPASLLMMLGRSEASSLPAALRAAFSGGLRVRPALPG